MEQIKLNTIPSGVPSVCHISQFDDTSRIIRCHLFNDADPLTLTGSETIKLFVRKSNNSRAEFEIESTSGTFIDLVITSEMSDIAGDSECKFQITDSEKTIGTLNFKMIVEPDAYGDSLKTRSVSGPIATFETDLAEDLIKLDVDLEPIQDLHGYDNPWPAGGGINQITVNRTKGTLDGYYPSSVRNFEYDKYYVGLSANNYYQESLIQEYSVGNDEVVTKTNRNSYGIAFPIKTQPNTNYYVGATLTGTAKIQFSWFDADGNHLGYMANISAPRVVTTPENCYTMVLIVYDGSASGETIKASNIFINLPSTVTEYTPYANICPISGHDSAQLFRTGKNWLNLNRTNVITNAGLYPSTIRTFTENDIWIGISRNNYFNNSRISSYSIDSNKVTVLTIAGGYGVGIPIRCKPSTAYRMANKEGYTIGIGFFDVDGNYLSDTTGSTFTTPNNCVWILVVFSGTANVETSYTNPQLELGSTATDYEPYESDPTPVTVRFGQTVYKGKLYSEQRKVLVTHVCETFDGSSNEEWTRHSATSVRYGFRIYFQYDKKPTTQSIDEMLSSVIPLRKSSETTSADDDIITCRSTTYLHKIFYIFAPPSKISTVEELRAFLANEPETVMYPLDEPFFIDLTQVQTADIEASPVASFETTLAMPLNTSEHSFSCSQAEGTPTPDSPIPITGVSEITAYRTGKNLLSPTLYKGLSYNPTVGTTVTLTESTKQLTDNHDGTFSISTTANWETFCMIVPIKSVTYYRKTVISSNGALGTSEVWLDKNLKVISAYNNTDTTQTKNGLLTIPDNASYFAWVITNRAVANSTLTITQPQLELGSTATSYEPYNGESITVSLGGTYYGGKLVQSEDGSRKIVLSHKKITLDGSSDESWNDYPTGNGFFINGINDHISESYGDGFSSTLPVSRSVSNLGIVFGIGSKYISKYIFLMQVKTSWNISTVSDLRTFLSNNPMDVTYKLETPLEINLPDGDPLTTIAGENNVYCNTGNTALTYYYNMVADPIRIPALVGTNNVYSDAGDVDVEYYTTLEGGND